MGNYISKGRLVEIFERMTKRELEILALLNEAKFMTTEQIRRWFFAKNENELSAKRAANRTMKKLEDAKLIAKLPRRIGGYFRENYGGSAPSVWKLTEMGYKILRMKHAELPVSRKHRIEGKPLFLEHDLGVMDAATNFRELEFSRKIAQLKLEFEPKCWRGFMNSGEPVSLKPDLYVRLINAGYEESYFLEIDRATEPIQRIFSKCQTYVSYFNSGIEEKATGLTPYIIWLVPDEKRRSAMEKLFREKIPEASVLFQVILEQELKTLVAGEEK